MGHLIFITSLKRNSWVHVSDGRRFLWWAQLHQWQLASNFGYYFGYHSSSHVKNSLIHSDPGSNNEVTHLGNHVYVWETHFWVSLLYPLCPETRWNSALLQVLYAVEYLYKKDGIGKENWIGINISTHLCVWTTAARHVAIHSPWNPLTGGSYEPLRASQRHHSSPDRGESNGVNFHHFLEKRCQFIETYLIIFDTRSLQTNQWKITWIRQPIFSVNPTVSCNGASRCSNVLKRQRRRRLMLPKDGRWSEMAVHLGMFGLRSSS